MNGDELSYLDYKNPQIWDEVSNADLIIVADVPDVETMQTLVVKAGETMIYYYLVQFKRKPSETTEKEQFQLF